MATQTIPQCSRSPDAPATACDRDLLGAFLDHHDPSAFASIVRRHGNMVLGVCRRVTGNIHDAEDAFQATFLVLARKADKVRPPEMLGHWLYGVAYRTALKARATAARNREGERRVAMMNPDRTSQDEQWQDLWPVLDEELSRLPARYRAAIVACDLEGKPRGRAAIDLGIHEGTLSSRLARGREILAARLSRRGVALSAVALATLMSGHLASAAPAGALVAATVQASVCVATGGAVAAGAVSAKAAILSEGVIQAMYITKAKIVIGTILGVLLAGTGVGVVTQLALADKPKAPKADNAPPKVRPDKSNWVKPDVSGTVAEISPDGKQITVQTSKGGKNEAPTTATVLLSDATQVTFSAIAADGDKVAQGYQAQVWLEPGSTDRAARVSYGGRESTKSLSRPADADGKVTAVSPDGKRFTVETFLPGDKGPKGGRGEPVSLELNVTPTTTTRFAGVTTGGARLQEGYEARVWLDPAARDNAVIVHLSGHDATGKKGEEKNPDMNAKVVGVAPDEKSITLEIPSKVKNEEPQRTQVTLAPLTKLVYDGVATDSARPTVDYRAEVWLDGTGNAARMVRFNAWPVDKGPDLSSAVLAVSADGKKITLELPPTTKGGDKGQKEVDIGAAKVIYSNVPPGQAKPTEGYEARVWLEPEVPGAAARVLFTKLSN